MNTQNSVTARLVYENAKAMLNLAGVPIDQAVLTQSDLILEQVLATTQSTYQFPVLNNQNGNQGNTIFNTEVRLALQDSFIVSAWGLFLCKASSATDATFIPQTYPNATLFPTGSVALGTIYNSIASIKVNNTVTTPVWHLSRHYMVPQSQQVAAAANQNGIGYSQVDMSSDGFFPCEPNFVIIGSKNTVIVVNLPAALSAVDATTRLRIHYRGLLAQNSTTVS